MKRHCVSLVGLVLLSVIASMVWAGGFLKIGEPAPAFSLTSITGETLSLNDLRGRVVVLGLFHICEPCRIQSTNLQKVHEATRGQHVSVVGVNSSGDSQADVREFVDTFPVKVTYPYLTDPQRVTDDLYGGGRFIPNVYVLDQDGVIRWQRVGNMALADHAAILEVVNSLLAGGESPPSMGGSTGL